MLTALGQYVSTLIDAFEFKYNVRPNTLIVGMLDAIYLSRAIVSWVGNDDEFPRQKEVLMGLELISSTKGNQEPTVCLI